jgi:hypothetical protein
MSVFASFSSAFPLRFSAVKLLLLSSLFVSSQLPADAKAASDPKAADCDFGKGACAKKSGDLLVTLDIQPKPVKVMQELSFTVTVKGAKDYDSLKLNLEMVGMFMGENEVTLAKTGPGRYTGKGIIPKCHSGKKLWSATLSIPGQPAKTSFLFNVLY